MLPFHWHTLRLIMCLRFLNGVFRIFFGRILLNFHTWKMKGEHHLGDPVLGCFHPRTPGIFMECDQLTHRFFSKCILSSQATRDIQDAIFMRISEYPPMPPTPTK